MRVCLLCIVLLFTGCKTTNVKVNFDYHFPDHGFGNAKLSVLLLDGSKYENVQF